MKLFAHIEKVSETYLKYSDYKYFGRNMRSAYCGLFSHQKACPNDWIYFEWKRLDLRPLEFQWLVLYSNFSFVNAVRLRNNLCNMRNCYGGFFPNAVKIPITP
jgi:hypothetical protein